MRIKRQIESLHHELPDDVTLVAISKYHSNEDIMEAYDAGQRVFGESHVQELMQKQPVLPKDIEWHFIGHLQTNKVKYIVPFVSLIHSVDSMKLLQEIDKQAGRAGRVVDVLLQLHVAQEETKFGFSKEELMEVIRMLTPDSSHLTPNCEPIRNVRICGLMCMATNTLDENQIRSEFRYAKEVFDEIAPALKSLLPATCKLHLSMGMSDDYEVAIDEGSTMVRIGSLIFGERNYD